MSTRPMANGDLSNTVSLLKQFHKDKINKTNGLFNYQFSLNKSEREEMFERNVASRYHSNLNYYLWNAETCKWDVQNHAGISYADEVMEIKKTILEGRL